MIKSKYFLQEDKVVEKWEKEFNKLMDTTKTTNAKLYYMTEVRYDFFKLVAKSCKFPLLSGTS